MYVECLEQFLAYCRFLMHALYKIINYGIIRGICLSGTGLGAADVTFHKKLDETHRS